MSMFVPQDQVNLTDYHYAQLTSDYGFSPSEAREIQLMQRDRRRQEAARRLRSRVHLAPQEAPRPVPHRRYRVVGSSAVTQGRGEYADPARLATRTTRLEQVEEQRDRALAHVARELFGA